MKQYCLPPINNIHTCAKVEFVQAQAYSDLSNVYGSKEQDLNIIHIDLSTMFISSKASSYFMLSFKIENLCDYLFETFNIKVKLSCYTALSMTGPILLTLVEIMLST